MPSPAAFLGSFILISLHFFLSPTRGHAADEPKSPPKTAVAGANRFRNVNVDEFDKLRAATNAIVLDVRTKAEFDKGHIPGAVNLDYHAADFSKRVAQLDRGKVYMVHCAAGVRSAKACGLMGQLAFTNLIHLEPGFRAWEKAGKPVAKP